jgi:hypothetical protein
MVAPIQLLRNWFEQQPSNHGNSGMLGEYYTSLNLYLILFLTVVRDYFGVAF